MPSIPRQSQLASIQTPVPSVSLASASKGSSSKKKRERAESSILQEDLSTPKKTKRAHSPPSPAQTRSKTRRDAICASKDVSSLFPNNVFPEMQKFKKDGGRKIQIRIIGLFYTEQGLEFKTVLKFAQVKANEKCTMTKIDGNSNRLKSSSANMHIEEIIARDENFKDIHDALDPILGSPELIRACMGLRVVMSEQPCGTKSRRCAFSVVKRFPEIFRFDDWGLSRNQIHVVTCDSRNNSGWISYKELDEIIVSKKDAYKSSRKSSRNRDSFDPSQYSLANIGWMRHDLDIREQGLIPWDAISDINTNPQQAQMFAP